MCRIDGMVVLSKQTILRLYKENMLTLRKYLRIFLGEYVNITQISKDCPRRIC